ncbi:MAG: SIR2 family protein [Theionarchaea archaeon]|nr:SIR2 family protein [Theionarchaea archaeon]
MNNEGKKKGESEEIIFFLGAGASVPANVPDTREFIYGAEGFLNHIDSCGTENEQKTLRILIERLERRLGKDQVDLEKVLETVTDLNNLDNNILTDFFEEKKPLFNKEDMKDLLHLEKKLREFIREMTIVSDDKIEYLEPLRFFTPLKVYSVNYDTCIEQFCKKYSLSYTDGFELYWHPEFFEDEEYQVKHYKLHGSVMWWKTNRNTYVKIPIKSPVENIELITGEIAENVIVYPVPGKADYSRPLLDLKSILYKDLKQARICIIIGYTFRDDSIKQVFLEAAEENHDLLIILISPSAAEIYDSQLKSRGNGSFSSLGGRVICFNYPVETVLGKGYLWKSLKVTEEIRSTFEKGMEYKKEEKGGWIHQFTECVSKCAEIGYVERANTILERYLGLKLEDIDDSKTFRDFGEKFNFFYMMGTSFLLNGYYMEAAEYFQKMYSLLRKMFDLGRKTIEIAIELDELKVQEKKVADNTTILKERMDEILSGREELKSHICTKESELRRFREEMDYEYSFFWCIYDSEWGREHFHRWVEFLETQASLLGSTRRNLVTEYLNPILDASSKVWKTINERSHSGGFDSQRIVKIDGFEVEIGRKEESEKYFELMLDSIQKLIDFLNSNEKIRN